jgi:hypothetical protein
VPDITAPERDVPVGSVPVEPKLVGAFVAVIV